MLGVEVVAQELFGVVCVCLCVCVGWEHTGMHVKVREQLAKAGSLASLCGSQELNSGLSDVMARHLLLHTEPSHQPSLLTFVHLFCIWKV